ncbi:MULTISPECIES: carbohydrate porin [unclassified Acinetobacter]|uniref:carbohydrate porin n=1 Tax=unclassified Acinetobacter TaxID=196816 RepID=UPI0015D42894|nr:MULTISPECIES: carbohydrate porin [unclassified Acinetobacter]UUS61403.1 carbohydrate porin [Acinetobacter sp. YH16056_T]
MKKYSLALLPAFVAAAMTHVHATEAFDTKGQYMLGDWDGKRTELAQQGVKFEANIAADAAYLADGGRNPGHSATVASQLWLGTQLDMEKLAGWGGVTVRAVMTARQGQSTSVRDLQGDVPQLANAQANFGRGNQDSRLTELSIEKNFKEQGISVKAGRLGLGMDFNVMACDFASTAFCAAQMGKWQGTIWMNTPVAQWGGRVKYQATPELAAQVGVYEFNPDNGNGKAEGQGWSLDTDNADGVSIPVELIWTPKQAVNGLPGSYRIGGMYNTADNAENQFDIAKGKVDGKGVSPEDRTFGSWIAIEQQLTSTGSGRQGLHSFANFTWHDRVTTKVDNSQQLGLKYIGLADRLPNDMVGLGVNRVHVNDRLSAEKFDASAEYNVELNYSHNPTKWLMIRPSLQYVINPGSTNRVDDAFLIGLSSKVIF